MTNGTSSPHLELQRSLEELARVHAFVEAVVERSGWPAALIFPLQLCLEEAISNVIRHGAASGGETAIRVTLAERGEDRTVVACVEDEGAPFDPTAAPPAPPGRSLAELAKGGHGLGLMRRFAARVSYSRIGAKNRLVLEFGTAA